MVKQYALVFDLRRCIGCLTCVIACKDENNLDAGYSWVKVLTKSEGKFPEPTMYWQPTTCMHCQNPPCIESCPLEAIHKRQDGIVLIEEGKCDGCLACQTACPYDVIWFNSDRLVVEKCTLCAHRIDQGLSPFCVRECTWKAIHFGDIGDPESEVSQLLDKRQGYVIRPEEGTEPSIHYLAPQG
jgi:Fe-S-cluster-containing dehydrogenase component